LRTQRNTRVQLTIALVAIFFGVWLGLSYIQWAVLVLTIGFVLVSEMLNTVAEALVDLMCPDYHLQAKVVKDVAAGVVLLNAALSVVVGLLVFGPLLWSRVFGAR
jgi:diacylglycerol kinase